LHGFHPFHLFQGTPRDNVYDAKNKGRMQNAFHPSKSTYDAGCRCDECRLIANKARKDSRYKNGFQPKTMEERKSTTVKQAEVYEIRRMFDNGAKIKEICQSFPKLQRRHIDDLAKRRKWKHLPEIKTNV
jgi:hypothetical protein